MRFFAYTKIVLSILLYGDIARHAILAIHQTYTTANNGNKN